MSVCTSTTNGPAGHTSAIFCIFVYRSIAGVMQRWMPERVNELPTVSLWRLLRARCRHVPNRFLQQRRTRRLRSAAAHDGTLPVGEGRPVDAGLSGTLCTQHSTSANALRVCGYRGNWHVVIPLRVSLRRLWQWSIGEKNPADVQQRLAQLPAFLHLSRFPSASSPPSNPASKRLQSLRQRVCTREST